MEQTGSLPPAPCPSTGFQPSAGLSPSGPGLSSD